MEKVAFNLGDTFFNPNDRFPRSPQGVGPFISSTISNTLVVAGIISIFLLIFAGIAIIGGSSGNNPQKTAQGKQAATAAVLGFVLIFVSYWLIQIVEILTGLDIL